MNTKTTWPWLAAIPGLYIALVDQPAHAYNFDTHQKMVEMAVMSMYNAHVNVVQLRATPPAGLNAGDWRDYINDLDVNYSRLRFLRAGLAAEGLTAQSEDAVKCGYPTNNNLAQIGLMRFTDANFFPKDSADGCSLQPSSFTTASVRNIGMTLGWHAGMVDNHRADTILGIKPNNTALFLMTKAWMDLLWEVPVAAVLLPFVCLWNWFSGHSCNPREAQNIAREINPGHLIDDVIPVVGDIRDGDVSFLKGLTGMWHFMNIDSIHGFYNSTPGLDYLYSGPGAVPDPLDTLIQVGADLGGLTLKDESLGVGQYAPFDSLQRSDRVWQRYPIGLTEFSPAQSLAQYGWANYTARPTEASWLGWPLHAIGDAVAPHHLVGTSGWGHRPFEDAAGDYWSEMFPEAAKMDGVLSERILREGFAAWFYLRQHPPQGSIREFVIHVGTQARQLIKDGDDWPYHYSLSMKYLEDNKAATAEYHADTAKIAPLVEYGMGATIALLVEAAKLARDPGRDGKIDCAAGTAYRGGDIRKCTAVATPPETEVVKKTEVKRVDQPLPRPASICPPVGTKCSDYRDCCAGDGCDKEQGCYRNIIK